MGLGNPNKMPQIRSLITNENLDWVGLTKTKLSSCNKFLVNRIWDSPSIRFEFCNAISSHSVGLVIMWNNDIFRVSRSHKRTRCIILQGYLIHEN